MLQSLVLSTLVAASGWMVPTAPGAVCGARGCLAAGPMLARCQRSVCMQEGQGPAAAATEPVSDFTEDLLDALATDEPALAEEPAVFHKGSGEVSLEPLPSYTNMRSVEEMRSKYMLHENDTGSSQVQIAVLTARIAYMTKHMETNKKDYSSLRGLTAMVTRRRKLLEFLLREDISEFKRLTSELGIRTNQLLKPKLTGARGRRV